MLKLLYNIKNLLFSGKHFAHFVWQVYLPLPCTLTKNIFSHILNSQISKLSATPTTVLFYPAVDKLFFENLTRVNNKLFRMQFNTTERAIVHKPYPFVVAQGGSD